MTRMLAIAAATAGSTSLLGKGELVSAETANDATAKLKIVSKTIDRILVKFSIGEN